MSLDYSGSNLSLRVEVARIALPSGVPPCQRLCSARPRKASAGDCFEFPGVGTSAEMKDQSAGGQLPVAKLAFGGRIALDVRVLDVGLR